MKPLAEVTLQLANEALRHRWGKKLVFGDSNGGLSNLSCSREAKSFSLSISGPHLDL